MSNKNKGSLGEDIACNYLIKNGYEIIDRNYHYSKFAEIDIIAKKNDLFIFCEVKARSALSCGHPLEAISLKKLEKMNLAIQNYMQASNLNDKPFRIDAISVVGFKNSRIEHFKGIYLD